MLFRSCCYCSPGLNTVPLACPLDFHSPFIVYSNITFIAEPWLTHTSKNCSLVLFPILFPALFSSLALIVTLYIVFTTRFGEGNGTPLQYSCLENPMDGCRKRRPSAREDGGVSGVSSSCGARGGFLPRHDEDLREPLVRRQGVACQAPLSMEFSRQEY